MGGGPYLGHPGRATLPWQKPGGKRAALSEARKIIRQACHILTELGDDALAPAA